MNFEPMWEKFAEYQQYAEKYGFGEAWFRMTTERTVEAANTAATSASAWSAECAAEAAEAAEAEAAAAVAAAAVAAAAVAAAAVAARAEHSIAYITRAIEQGGKE